MSTLTLIRHGQSEPFQGTDSDLTALGRRQAEALARHWLAKGVGFDEVWSGTLPRQVQTGQIVGECFEEAGRPWPAAGRDPSWNEYDAEGVLSRMVPRELGLAALAAEFEAARGTPDEKRKFQRMFEAAMLAWLECSTLIDGVELFPAFRERVTGALARLAGGGAGRRVAVFTSGGAIGFTVSHAMKAPPRSFLDVNWRVRNSSITEFVFDRDRLTLDSFNGIPHLDEARLRTWR